jgi:hypothetical protein
MHHMDGHFGDVMLTVRGIYSTTIIAISRSLCYVVYYVTLVVRCDVDFKKKINTTTGC